MTKVFAPTLTDDEHRALIKAANGLERQALAEALETSTHNAKNWLSNAITKLGGDNIQHAVAIGFCTGLITEYNITGFYVAPPKVKRSTVPKAS